MSVLVTLSFLFGRVNTARAEDLPTSQQSTNKFKKLSLEELMDQEVTVVSKTPEKLSQSASAVQVVTGEDIRRSGATTLPEALQEASNLEVAQVNSHDWAISSRGFNNTLANKLLVMIDGRTIYTPLYAGVFWDVQSVLLEDVDRIEVVSGPGGTLWGANAVNGVINIITRSAKDTQGGYLSAGGGSFLQDFGAVRYGGRLGTNLFYRVYAQHLDHFDTKNSQGLDATNAWDMTQGGFRMDYESDNPNKFTLQGDVYGGGQDLPGKNQTIVDGQNILGRWTHTFSEASEFSVQMYFDRTWRDIPQSFAEALRTYDLDFQHRFPLGQRQSVLWGAGYRLMDDNVRNTPGLTFQPPHKDMQLFSGFVQDEIVLLPDHLKLAVGTKLEHNDFSGFEFQPSVRITGTVSERQTIWGAVSRAVRSPSRIESDASTPVLVPNVNFDSEKLLAYELGYRVQPYKRLSLSVASYYNIYDDLRSVDQVAPGLVTLANHFKGETCGVELSATYQVTDHWRVRGGYNYLHKNLWQTDPAASSSIREGNDPQNQFSFQSILDLPANLQLDITGRYVDMLPSPVVPSYFTFDVRLAWTWRNAVEFSIVGQNLGSGDHAEFGTPTTRQEIPRSIYGKVTWRF